MAFNAALTQQLHELQLDKESLLHNIAELQEQLRLKNDHIRRLTLQNTATSRALKLPQPTSYCCQCKRNNTTTLPAEIWLRIFYFSPLPSMCRTAVVCRFFARLSRELPQEIYWKGSYISMFGKCIRTSSQSGGWKQYTLNRYRAERNWRANSNVVYTLQGHKGTVTCLHFIDDMLVTGSDDGSMICWSLLHNSKEECGQGSPQLLQQHHLQTKANGAVRLHSLNGHGGPVWSCSADGGQVVSGSYDKTIKVWDMSSGKCMHTLRGFTSWVSSVAFSFNQKRIVSASYDSTIRVWQSDGGQIHAFPTEVGDAKYCLSWNKEHDKVTVGSQNKIQIWDLNTAAKVREYEDSTVLSVWNQSASNMTVSASADRTIKIYDSRLATGFHTIHGHESPVMDVKSDGAFRLVSCSTDKSIRIWDTRMLGDVVDLSWKQWSEDSSYVVPGKACINTIEAHSGGVFCVQFDHIKILSGSSDRSAKVISFR